MCGIWGFATSDENLADHEIKEILNKLFILSESRGKDSAGISCCINEKIEAVRHKGKASQLIKSDDYKEFLCKALRTRTDGAFAAVGHCGLADNGTTEQIKNCQPVIGHHHSIAHNGIIVNKNELEQELLSIERKTDLDSEKIIKCYSHILGTASVVGIASDETKLFAITNNGSLYYYKSENCKTILFASEYNIAKKILKSTKTFHGNENIDKLQACRGIVWCKDSLDTFPVSQKMLYGKAHSMPEIYDGKFSSLEPDYSKIEKLKRCSKCLLPETMPFIEFDVNGECNYCKHYKKPEIKGEKELWNLADNIKKKQNGKILLTFSGGRDSSYSLHYVKKELGLDALAYSYDWGVVTDLARRNQSRMCSKLETELIVVSADINKKRENIRKNILAWINKPALGIVPLFMAGDKQYFYYANKVARENAIDTICLSTNRYEQTYFKYGFCGIKPSILQEHWDERTELLPKFGVLQMMSYYIKQYIQNPRYINKSIWDTAFAAISNYGIPHNYLQPFDYLDWDEKVVDEVLINQYDWETLPGSVSTWRIGDGTAPFYNYIYYILCGFTENECLRSNQIRAGKITREQGMEYIKRDNQLRFDELKWYFDILSLDMEEVLASILKYSPYRKESKR